jgi:hypothetical protein
MFHHNFDPYDTLVSLNDRLNRLERAHNKLADAYTVSQRDLSITMDSLISLQKSHLSNCELLRRHGISSK